MDIKSCAVYNNDATVVGIYSPLPSSSLVSVPPSVLCGRPQSQMGQTASVKLSQFVICSSSTTEEEQEDFRPHHPRFVVTAEVPNSKPASLQPNRYSESNRSLQSLAKDSFVPELVSRPSAAPVVVRPRCGSRRAADPAAVYPGLIAKHFDSVSQHLYLLRLLHRHLHHHLLPLPPRCKDTRSPRSIRHSSSILSTNSSKNLVKVPTDASSPLNIVDPERVVRSRKSPTLTPSVS